jgi:hypothetical protein
MSMRISKYLPIFGLGGDMHMALPPSMPPPPPAPPNPAPIPVNRYVVTIASTAAQAIFGKWTLASVATEGMGDILWGYDWGPLQMHIAIGPALITPSLAILPLGSSIKYFLPSFAIQEKADGGALASGSTAAVAVSTPGYYINGQDCQDSNGIGFVLPTSMLFQQVSVRWVGFCFGDMAAGFIGMAGDAAAAALVSHFGGKLLPKTLADDQLLAGLGGTAIVHIGGLLSNLPGWGLLGVGGVAGVAALAGAGPLAAVLAAPLVSYAAGQAATAVGENWGSKPGDWGYAEGGPPAATTPAPAPAPAPAPTPEPEPEPAGPPAPTTTPFQEGSGPLAPPGETSQPDEEPNASFPPDGPTSEPDEEPNASFAPDPETDPPQ